MSTPRSLICLTRSGRQPCRAGRGRSRLSRRSQASACASEGLRCSSPASPAARKTSSRCCSRWPRPAAVCSPSTCAASTRARPRRTRLATRPLSSPPTSRPIADAIAPRRPGRAPARSLARRPHRAGDGAGRAGRHHSLTLLGSGPGAIAGEPGRDAARHAGRAGRGGRAIPDAGPACRAGPAGWQTSTGAAGQGRGDREPIIEFLRERMLRNSPHRPGRHGPVPARLPGPDRGAGEPGRAACRSWSSTGRTTTPGARSPGDDGQATPRPAGLHPGRRPLARRRGPGDHGRTLTGFWGSEDGAAAPADRAPGGQSARAAAPRAARPEPHRPEPTGLSRAGLAARPEPPARAAQRRPDPAPVGPEPVPRPPLRLGRRSLPGSAPGSRTSRSRCRGAARTVPSAACGLARYRSSASAHSSAMASARPQLPGQRLLVVLPGEYAGRSADDAVRPAGRAVASPARPRQRVQRERQRGPGVIDGQHVPAGLVVHHDEVASVPAARAGHPAGRSGPDTAIRSVLVATVRSTPTGSLAGSRPVDVGLHHAAGTRAGSAADCASSAKPSVSQPCSSRSPAARHGPLPAGQPPPAGQRVVHAGAEAVVRPRRRPCAAAGGPGRSSGTGAGSPARCSAGSACTRSSRRGMPSKPSCSTLPSSPEPGPIASCGPAGESPGRYSESLSRRRSARPGPP